MITDILCTHTSAAALRGDLTSFSRARRGIMECRWNIKINNGTDPRQLINE